MLFDQISLLAAGGALVLAAFALNQIARRPSDTVTRLLGFLIAACAVNAAHPAVTRMLGLGSPGSETFFEPLQLLLAPLMAAYARSAVEGPFPLLPKMTLHFVPFAIGVVVSIGLTLSGAIAPWVSVAFWAVISVQMLAYLAPALRRFHRYQATLADEVSNWAPADLGWLRWFFGLAFGLCLVSFTVLILLLHSLDGVSLGPGVAVVLAGAVWVLARKGLDHRMVPTVTDSERSPLSPIQAKSAAVAVQDLFESQKPHLNPDLSLGDLAALTGLGRTQLSYVINNELQVNFYDLVNSWRVKEFRRLAADARRDQDKLLTLAFEAGFNSKPTFNKVVLKTEGKTPSQVRKEEIESRRNR